MMCHVAFEHHLQAGMSMHLSNTGITLSGSFLVCISRVKKAISLCNVVEMSICLY